MESVWFTSDTHFGHKRMLDFRPFETTDEMDEVIITNWNRRVAKNERVYHLGDFSFSNKEKTAEIINRLHGQIHLVKGNHDKTLDRLSHMFTSFQDYKTIKVNEQRIVLFHYSMRTWDMSHYGSWHLYGHCFDEETEVLTFDGWKTRKNICIEDHIATIAYPDDTVVYQNPTEIVDVIYTGSQYELTGRNVNGLFTPDHIMIIANTKTKELDKIRIKDFTNRTNRHILLNGRSGFNDYPIEDNLLRLYIWLVTDGSIENSNLGRFHLSKERKIKYLSSLLDQMGIQYSQNLQSSGTTKISFTIPDELLRLGIKPLNPFVKTLSQRQGIIVVEEYLNTDGNKQGKTSFQICTGKPIEADLLQHFLVTHGYSCNLHHRHRDLNDYGYGVYDTWILSGNSKRVWQTTKSFENINTTSVQDKPFWCLKVPNQTLIIRRNGMVHVTGNSHGNLADDPGAFSMDVGVDPNGLYPVSFEEVQAHMSTKTFVPVDHHR